MQATFTTFFKTIILLITLKLTYMGGVCETMHYCMFNNYDTNCSIGRNGSRKNKSQKF